MPDRKLDAVVDVINTTHEHFIGPNYADLMAELPRYHAMKYLREGKNVRQFTGKEITFRALVRDSGTARFQSYGSSKGYSDPTLTEVATIPWRHGTTDYGWFRQEILANSGVDAIISLVEIERAAAMQSLANIMETAMWGLTAASDTTTPWGIQNWVTPTGATTTVARNGSLPTGYSNVAGIPSTIDRWKNVNFQYSAFTEADLFGKMRQAFRLCNHMPAVPTNQLKNGRSEQYMIYCNNATMSSVEGGAVAQNDNIGADIVSFYEGTKARGFNWEYVPELDDNASNLILGLDWAFLYFGVLRGDYFHEEPARKLDSTPNRIVKDIDITYNFYCTDRSHQWVATL